MMTVVNVKFDFRKLDEIIAQLPERSEAIVRSGALAVEGYAKTRAPVDTGALKNSIKAAPAGKLHWDVADGMEYGIWQEIGVPSRNLPAHPFMVPGVERARPQYLRMWDDVCKV